MSLIINRLHHAALLMINANHDDSALRSMLTLASDTSAHVKLFPELMAPEEMKQNKAGMCDVTVTNGDGKPRM